MTATGIMASIVAQNKIEYEIFCDSLGFSLNIFNTKLQITILERQSRKLYARKARSTIVHY